MLMKATRLHPSVPLQVYVLVMVGAGVPGVVIAAAVVVIAAAVVVIAVTVVVAVSANVVIIEEIL